MNWLDAVLDLAQKSPLLVCGVGLGLLSALHIARIVIAISTFFVELIADDLFDCWKRLKVLGLAAMPWRRHPPAIGAAVEKRKLSISSVWHAPTVSPGLDDQSCLGHARTATLRELRARSLAFSRVLSRHRSERKLPEAMMESSDRKVANQSDIADRRKEVLLPVEMSSRRMSRTWWMAAGAAATVALVFTSMWWTRASRQTDAVATLVAAAPAMHRSIEPRMTGGFPWAPLATATRGESNSFGQEEMRFIGAAGAVLEQTAGDDSIEAQHAAALAYLVAGRTSDGLAILMNLSVRTTDARIWSDLGAASYTDALERGDEVRFGSALAATSMAVRLDSRFPEALFNRALILERLGMTREARDTWNRYIAIESQGAWKAEAARHLRALAPQPEDGHESRREYDQAPDSAPAVKGNRVLHPTLYAAAQSAALKANWSEALYLLGLALDRSQVADAEASTVQLLLMRARIEIRIGLSAAARADVARARPIIDRIADPSARTRANAARLTVEAALAPSPAAAVRILVGSLGSHNRIGTEVASTYLLRGRSFAALGQVDKAYADFEAGIRHVDGTTETRAKQSWETTIAREELFDEAVALALSRGEWTLAFEYTQRARTPRLDTIVEPSVVGDRSHVFIEYKVLRDHVAIFVAKDGHLRVAQTEVRSEALSAELNHLTADTTLRDATQFRHAARTLYDLLLAPVANELENRRTLVIVPDGLLDAVPFAALVGPSGRYVLEDHPVVMAPSSIAYARLAARPPAPAVKQLNLLLVAGTSRHDGELGRLFSAQREVDAVAAAYGMSGNRIAAGGSGFAARAVDASIIHIASHAIVSANGQPALLLSDGRGNPEQLDAGEIEAMDLRNSSLVVLSACSSGLSVKEGSQTSLVRSFLTAGAAAVVGTLWDIEDGAASSFFPRLHHYLAQGASPADALRAAQIECIRRGDTAPKMWAAAQVIESGLSWRDGLAAVEPTRTRVLRSTSGAEGTSHSYLMTRGL